MFVQCVTPPTRPTITPWSWVTDPIRRLRVSFSHHPQGPQRNTEFISAVVMGNSTLMFGFINYFLKKKQAKDAPCAFRELYRERAVRCLLTSITANTSDGYKPPKPTLFVKGTLGIWLPHHLLKSFYSQQQLIRSEFESVIQKKKKS